MAIELTQASAMEAISSKWEVEYSRFFHFPSLSSSASTDLSPLSTHTRARLRGTWLSSSPSSTTASVNLSPDFSNSDSILSVTFLGKVHEEHYISRLNFTWPHVSCMSGFPPRGSRVVFVSYKDHTGQIQKFVLRFSEVCQIETFITTLKELMAIPKHFGNQNDDRLVSEISSESDFIPAEEVSYRSMKDWNSAITLYSDAHPFESSFNSEVSHKPISSQTTVPMHNVESSFEGLPPSFMSLMMMSSQANVEEVKPILVQEADMKLQLMRCLDDSSFQDILSKVEEVMCEMRNDMLM